MLIRKINPINNIFHITGVTYLIKDFLTLSECFALYQTQTWKIDKKKRIQFHNALQLIKENIQIA